MHVCFILGAKASSLNPWFLHILGYETPRITLRPQYSLCQEQHGHSSESFAFLRCKTGGKQGDNQGEVLNCDIKIVMLACPASYKKKQFSQRSGCTWHWQPRPPAETPRKMGSWLWEQWESHNPQDPSTQPGGVMPNQKSFHQVKARRVW